MAEVTTYIDDLDGAEGAQPTEFEAEGKLFTADLTPQHKQELEDALATVKKYVAVADEVKRPVHTAFNQLSKEEREQCRKDLKRPTGRIQDADVEAWRTKSAEGGKKAPAGKGAEKDAAAEAAA